MTTEKLTKADRLAIGAAVAPTVRRAADAPRKVTVVDKNGKPVRETTHVEVAKAILARSEIEFSVQEGKRPQWVKCKDCGAPVKVGRSGAVREVCRPRTHKCACGRPVTPKAGCGFGKSCARCTGAKKLAGIPRDERSARSTRHKREWWSQVAPEERSKRARRMCEATPAAVRQEIARQGGRAAMAKRTPEKQAEISRRAIAAMTPEQRREMAERSKAARAALPPEVRSEAVRKQWAAMTQDEKAARGHKSWETRRANNPSPPRATCACGALLRKGAKRCRPCWKTRGSGT